MPQTTDCRQISVVPAARLVAGDVQTWFAPRQANWRVRRTAAGQFLQLRDVATGEFGSLFDDSGIQAIGTEEP